MLTETLIERLEIEQFLIKEASLLDQDKLDEWLDLFTEDSVYWIPAGGNDIDPETHVNIIYEDYKLLSDRVSRLQSGFAYGQIPKSKVSRTVSNVEILEKDNDKVVVSSRFVLVEIRRSIQTVYAGRYVHDLVKQGDSWKIARKKVELLNNDEFMGNLSFLV